MKYLTPLLFLAFSGFLGCGSIQEPRHERLFDEGWKFHLGDVVGAENPDFTDASWRDVDLPHDWSIEKLPGQNPDQVVGPFSKESPGATATGYTLGGTGWYRKTFTLNDQKSYGSTLIDFDGVYMNCDVWVNGRLVGSHPYGYTAFHYDLTDFLNPAGQPNVIAVKVKNEGKNSRWYSGSGIYRHVWLIQKQAVHVAHQGVWVTTESISPGEASVRIATTVHHTAAEAPQVELAVKVIGPDGQVAQEVCTPPRQMSSPDEDIVRDITVSQPALWSIETPNLYTAEIQVVADGVVTDQVKTLFGIRTIHFDAQTGFTLNGQPVLLKGGCMHHDNGFLGSAAIDRAEERRVQLMKSYGFNAIRTSHNPPSRQFLDACDRNGILVMDEAFDQWERAKNPKDYHLYFKEWWQRDLESMILRDRNHPSVIFWSIGNELNERAEPLGYAITRELADYVRKLDPTRPVTEALCSFWDHQGQEWSTTAPAFALLDVGGYNYMVSRYGADHVEFPERVMVGTESFPKEAHKYWKPAEEDPWVIGDFVWTGMDYLGETGLGNSRLSTERVRGLLRTWPWFNANSGDIDLCGFKKPQMVYRDVLWNNSKLEMAVHAPIPEGQKELVSPWGWPDERQSWNWKGHEGERMSVRIFSSYPEVRLELNGKVIDQKTLGDDSELTADFSVPYEPGVLRAVALENGVEAASKELKTTGAPAGIRLVADRTEIRADRNDLSYVKVEVVDAQGNRIPDAGVPVTFAVSGIGEIAGSGNACPDDMESFNNSVCKT
ncbi:MAG: glycoside hydrolase family 2 TIM barrel-domain containing protein, partial [Acidobacteriota bacterium]